jgi:Protein of unknown function (DUF2752)
MEPSLFPGWLTKRLPASFAISRNINVLASCSLITLILTSGWGSRIAFIPHFCLFQRLLGVPCPGCGITRSLLAAARCDFSAAWKFNPAGIVIWLFLLFEIAARACIVRKRQLALDFQRVFSGFENVVIVSLFLVWFCRLVFILRT